MYQDISEQIKNLSKWKEGLTNSPVNDLKKSSPNLHDDLDMSESKAESDKKSKENTDNIEGSLDNIRLFCNNMGLDPQSRIRALTNTTVEILAENLMEAKQCCDEYTKKYAALESDDVRKEPGIENLKKIKEEIENISTIVGLGNSPVDDFKKSYKAALVYQEL